MDIIQTEVNLSPQEEMDLSKSCMPRVHMILSLNSHKYNSSLQKLRLCLYLLFMFIQTLSFISAKELEDIFQSLLKCSALLTIISNLITITQTSYHQNLLFAHYKLIKLSCHMIMMFTLIMGFHNIEVCTFYSLLTLLECLLMLTSREFVKFINYMCDTISSFILILNKTTELRAVFFTLSLSSFIIKSLVNYQEYNQIFHKIVVEPKTPENYKDCCVKIYNKVSDYVICKFLVDTPEDHNI